MRKHITAMLILAACHMGINAQSTDVNTHRQYLSGTGCDDTVLWDFKCSDGRNAGQWLAPARLYSGSPAVHF